MKFKNQENAMWKKKKVNKKNVNKSLYGINHPRKQEWTLASRRSLSESFESAEAMLARFFSIEEVKIVIETDTYK